MFLRQVIAFVNGSADSQISGTLVQIVESLLLVIVDLVSLYYDLRRNRRPSICPLNRNGFQRSSLEIAGFLWRLSTSTSRRGSSWRRISREYCDRNFSQTKTTLFEVGVDLIDRVTKIALQVLQSPWIYP